MAEKAIEHKVGSYAFILGVIVAIITGLASNWLPAGVATALLVVFGAVVGFLNVSEKETSQFLIAAIALMAAGGGNFVAIPTIGIYISSILVNVASFVAPAAIIVGLKSVYNLSSRL
ncbi:hypothetical protein HY546_03220 [archaeon]|nr:hypothetical protein [archaeon]